MGSGHGDEDERRRRRSAHVRGEDVHGTGTDPSAGLTEAGSRLHTPGPDDAHLARDGAHPPAVLPWVLAGVLLVVVVVLLVLLLG